MPLKAEERNFQNPEFWHHSGGFRVELREGVYYKTLKRLPRDVLWTGEALAVTNGTAFTSSAGDGVRFFAQPGLNAPFSLRYEDMVCIRTDCGTLLWRNPDA